MDHPSLRLCLDIGHVNAYSGHSILEWLEQWSPLVSHFHIHNNDGTQDQHAALTEGSIPMAAVLRSARELCPDATFTFELIQAEPSMRWLREEGIL